jgi:hypothetical protein
MATISGCRHLKVNLKPKIYRYVNSTTQRCPNKIIKIFLVEGYNKISKKWIRQLGKQRVTARRKWYTTLEKSYKREITINVKTCVSCAKRINV